MSKTMKKLIVSLLSVLMILAYMPAMAFAAEPEYVASVSSQVITEPIQCTTFAQALSTAASSENVGKKPVITLLDEIVLPASYTISTPMTIELNGHTISTTEEHSTYKLSPDAGPQGSADVTICRKDTDTSIIFAAHTVSQVTYNWVPDGTGYKVASKTVECDNCGKVTETITGGVVTYEDSVDGKTRTYTWTLGDESSTKTVDLEAAPIYSDPAASIFSVAGINQHKDGLPVVNATVKKTGSTGAVEAVATVTAATEDEIKSLTEDGITVFQENGSTPAATKVNDKATCSTKGSIIYKVVVSAKDGTVVGDPIYLKDSQAVPEANHSAGPLKGIKYLVKDTGNADGNFETEAAALAEAKEQGRDAVKVTSYESAGVTYYAYWYFGNTTNLYGNNNGGNNTGDTRSGSRTKTLTAADANLEDDGSFTFVPVYFCNDENYSAANPGSVNEVLGDAVVMSPLPDATTPAEYNNNNGDGSHSTCTRWMYESKAFTYEFGTEATPYKYTCTINFGYKSKDAEHYSHVDDGTQTQVMTPATCAAPGTARVRCKVCGLSNYQTTVEIPKLADTFAAYPGTDTPASTVFSIEDTALNDKHAVTLNADRTEAVVAPTCVQPGGTFKYCTGENNNDHAHWVLQGDPVPATGHTFLTATGTAEWTNAVYAPTGDTICTVNVVCSNKDCDGSNSINMKYHSIKGTNDVDDTYDAIDVVTEEKGKDCQTAAKTTFTVKGVTYSTGDAITTEAKGGDDTKGDHVLEVTSFNWSKDLEAATVTAKCTVKGCGRTDLTDEAAVTKATDATGLTTYTATYGEALGGKTESKKAYTLKDAEVTYDTSKLTDARRIAEIKDYAAKDTPEVTVKVNGTVIDSKVLKEAWSYDTAKGEVNLTVSFDPEKQTDTSAAKFVQTADADPYKVAQKKLLNYDKATVKRGTKAVTVDDEGWYDGDYDPKTTWSVEAAVEEEDVTVKYAVLDEPITGTGAQAKIDALEYKLDKIDDLKDTGMYYVYAQFSKDGYTTLSIFVARISIDKPNVTASIDNFTMKQGETPDYKMVITRNADRTVVDVDPADFTVTTVGGQKLEDLLPGDYRLLVTSGNYNVTTAFTEGRVGSVTVLTKDGKTPEQDAKDAAEAADKALAEAAKITADAYTADSVAAVETAKAALEAAQKAGSTAEVKAATEALNAAIKGAVALQANPMTVKAKTVKAKAKKKTTIKKAKAFTVKNAEGKVTFKKTKGDKKISVSKAGKVTVKKGLKKGKTYKVKVKVTAAGNGNYLAKSKTVTLKVKVK